MRKLTGFLVFLLIAHPGSAQDRGEVSIYVSLDQEFSEELLDVFQERSGIKVRKTFDTEDNKTIGMVNRIISEKNNPRCDVYWNNELGQTIRLKNMGLLQPHRSANAATIPPTFRDPDGFWTGFAARARVFIYNKDKLGPDELPVGLDDLVNPKWQGRITMAKPLTGTTLTNLGALFSVWGEEKTKNWVDQLMANEIHWNKGNAQVMRDVGAGAFAWGFTDTDDANVSRTVKGHPTDIVVPDQGTEGRGTLVIPNSVMIIKDAKNLENARTLVDYILSMEVEEKLARGRSAQIPLHPGVPVPEGNLRLDQIKALDVDWEDVGRQLETHGEWLHRKFEGGGENAGSKGRTGLWIAIAVGVLTSWYFLNKAGRVKSN